MQKTQKGGNYRIHHLEMIEQRGANRKTAVYLLQSSMQPLQFPSLR